MSTAFRHRNLPRLLLQAREAVMTHYRPGLREQESNFGRMDEILISGVPPLVFMRFFREFVCFRDESDIRRVFIRHRLGDFLNGADGSHTRRIAYSV